MLPHGRHRRSPGKLTDAAAALYAPESGPNKPAGGFDLSYLYVKKNVEVWPENWRAFQLFTHLQSQWRVGVGGATGLDYTPAFHLMDRMGLEPSEWDDLFGDLRAMESAALRQINAST